MSIPDRLDNPHSGYGEAMVSEDLDLAGYGFKWKKAKEMALRNDGDENTRILPYWERVRLLFLELGGLYVNQKGQDRP